MTRPPDHPIRKLLIATEHQLNLYVAPEWFAERMKKDFPSLEVVRLTSYARIADGIADADVVFSQVVNRDHFLAAKKLRWIHSPSAAVHQFLYPELTNSEVVLTNGREVHAPVVAEQVMAMIFALARKIPESVRFQLKHVWAQGIFWDTGISPTEVADATLGLVGLGSIGRNVAQRASAMGMKVIAVREHADRAKPEHVDEVLPASRLHELLSRSDYVVLSPPVTPATKGMIGREQLAAMKKTAYLINVGRGPLVVEADLVEALRSRQIAGAALDVFDQEPLPAESPLWDLENLLITPHTGGMTEKMWDRHYAVFTENLRRFMAREPLLAVVDKRAGY
jgi:D-2-hydroxyacid dehydrogenase (NADP+)